MQIGHIQEAIAIPPELAAYAVCEICEMRDASILLVMDKKFSDDLQVCVDDARKVMVINSLIKYIEVEN